MRPPYAKSPYVKPVLDINQQIERLRDRGVIIADADRAAHCLLHVNYYRLRAYLPPFERLESGAAFEDVYALHEFDRLLRRLLMDAIEQIEISLRANWVDQMIKLGDGHAYMLLEHYRDEEKHNKNKKHLEGEISRSKEVFIKHYNETYTPEFPPVWMAVEIMSFGCLSHWFANLGESRASFNR